MRRSHDVEAALLLTAPAAFALARLSTAGGIGRIAGSCWWHTLIGVPCPTCGATRAAVALARGEWHAAFAVQPLVTILSVLVVLYLPWAAGVVWLGWRPLRLDFRGSGGRAWRWALIMLTLANWGYLVYAGV